MTTMYRTEKWDYTIKEVEILRDSPYYVWFDKELFLGSVRETREAKESLYQNWYTTYQEAHKALMYRVEQEIKGLETKIRKAKSERAILVLSTGKTQS